jgi:hypothetical protein
MVECFHNAEPGIPASPKLPQVFDPATVPNVGPSPDEVLHYSPCMGITSIFTNPPTHLERELQYDTMIIAIARAVSSW